MIFRTNLYLAQYGNAIIICAPPWDIKHSSWKSKKTSLINLTRPDAQNVQVRMYMFVCAVEKEGTILHTHFPKMTLLYCAFKVPSLHVHVAITTRKKELNSSSYLMICLGIYQGTSETQLLCFWSWSPLHLQAEQIGAVFYTIRMRKIKGQIQCDNIASKIHAIKFSIQKHASKSCWAH